MIQVPRRRDEEHYAGKKGLKIVFFPISRHHGHPVVHSCILVIIFFTFDLKFSQMSCILKTKKHLSVKIKFNFCSAIWWPGPHLVPQDARFFKFKTWFYFDPTLGIVAYFNFIKYLPPKFNRTGNLSWSCTTCSTSSSSCCWWCWTWPLRCWRTSGSTWTRARTRFARREVFKCSRRWVSDQLFIDKQI